MNNYHALIENLRQCAKEWMNPGPTALRNAADAIETLTTELTEERHNQDRLQDWDRGMTEKLEQAQKRIAELEGK